MHMDWWKHSMKIWTKISLPRNLGYITCENLNKTYHYLRWKWSLGGPARPKGRNFSFCVRVFLSKLIRNLHPVYWTGKTDHCDPLRGKKLPVWWYVELAVHMAIPSCHDVTRKATTNATPAPHNLISEYASGKKGRYADDGCQTCRQKIPCCDNVTNVNIAGLRLRML